MKSATLQLSRPHARRWRPVGGQQLQARSPRDPPAYSYIRFSQKKQQKGESFRRQSEFANEVCAENGWTLDGSLTLHDLGVSAFRGANAKVGALGEFLEAVRIGRVAGGSVLIIESIDRLSRNKVGEALQLFISILNCGVSIVTREPRRHHTQDSINDLGASRVPRDVRLPGPDQLVTPTRRGAGRRPAAEKGGRRTQPPAGRPSG
jgi:hypothetical protein